MRGALGEVGFTRLPWRGQVRGAFPIKRSLERKRVGVAEEGRAGRRALYLARTRLEITGFAADAHANSEHSVARGEGVGDGELVIREAVDVRCSSIDQGVGDVVSDARIDFLGGCSLIAGHTSAFSSGSGPRCWVLSGPFCGWSRYYLESCRGTRSGLWRVFRRAVPGVGAGVRRVGAFSAQKEALTAADED